MPERDYPFDNIDGRWVEPRVITRDETLTRTHQGSVRVEEASSLQLMGTLQGSLHLEPAARVTIIGSHQGSLWVTADASVTVCGKQQGSVHVAAGGEVVVEPDGTLAGSLHNEGTIRNSGIRGGTVSGDGVIEDLPGSSVKQPVMRNGMTVYTW